MTHSKPAPLLNRLRHFAFYACVSALPLALAFLQAQAQEPVKLLAGHVPQAVASSRLLRPAARETRLHLSIGLPLRNPAELDALLQQINDPYSPAFHKFLTPAQFAAQFGPTDEDYQALIQFAHQSGLTITQTHSNHGVLSVSGAVADVEKAFQVKLNTYSHPTRGEFYAPDREPSVPASLHTLDISGLDNFAPPHPMALKTQPLTNTSARPNVTGSGPGGYLIGKDFRAAYAPAVTLTGAGQTIGLLEFDGFFAGDMTKNFAQAGLTPVPTQTVLLDGISGSAGGDNVEVILDIMMASYMAPGLSKVIVYEGENPNDILNRMATDNLAQQLSSSWGFSGVNATTEQIFKQYIAQGQSLMQASGDSGSYSGGIMTPSDDPNLTVVGGTSVVTSGPSGPWQSETAWSGSGGGVSTTYAIPSYQQTVAMASKGGSTSMRNIPDVALTADIQMYLICNNGQQISVGGTSAAAPLWAGFLALANQQAASAGKPRVGFLNPLIYGIGTGGAIGGGGNYASDMHDITVGSNGGFKSLAGYDLTTGWGSPAGQGLINDLTGVSTAASFTLAASTSAVSLRLPMTGNATATATLTVTPRNSFTGTVTLAATGMPAGVTAVFTPVTAGTSASASTLTFTALPTALAGTYPLTITGVSGKLSATTTLTLTVLAPSFTLTPSATSLAALPPASVTSNLAIAGVNGFTGAIAFTASSLPAGVTASFTAATVGASASATSTLTFAVAAKTVAGTYVIPIKGVSGAFAASTSITLTVAYPGFTLSSSAAALTVLRGSSAPAVLSIADQNGFASAVALSTSTLPTGVTASFNPATTTSRSTLTLTAGTTAVAGTYALTVTGISGSLTASTPISLTVTTPSFTLAFAPASVAILRGSTAVGAAVVTGTNGFTGTVAFNASGLPAGVTALFGAPSATGYPVTLTAASTAPAGAYSVVLTGTSGTLSATAKFTLTVVAPTAGTTFVNLAPSYNVNGFDANSLPFTGVGLDGGSNGSPTAYSATLIGLQQTVAGTGFYFGPANALDAVSGKTVLLPTGQFTSLKFLATAVNGAQLAQSFKITYTDGTSTTITQSLSDWFTPGSYASETKGLTMAYRVNVAGQIDNRTFYLYEYSLPLNPAKTVASVTLPANRNVVLLAATLASATSSVH